MRGTAPTPSTKSWPARRTRRGAGLPRPARWASACCWMPLSCCRGRVPRRSRTPSARRRGGWRPATTTSRSPVLGQPTPSSPTRRSGEEEPDPGGRAHRPRRCLAVGDHRSRAQQGRDDPGRGGARGGGRGPGLPPAQRAPLRGGQAAAPAREADVIGLYAIAQGAPAGGQGAQGEELRRLRCGALELVTGAAPPPLSEADLRAHEAAVRAIAGACGSCLPARFGAAAADEESLLSLLGAREPELAAGLALGRGRAQMSLRGAREPELAEALALVRGREQMTLRVHVPAGAVAAGNEGGPGTRYLAERRRARAVPELDPLRAALAAWIRAERVERHGGETGLLASAYHLVDRGSAAAYQDAVEATPLAGLRASVTGPWPAWAFAPELWL